MEPARLDLLVEDIVGSLALLAEERHLTLSAESTGPILISLDAGRMIQAIMALVENALRYTPAGGDIIVASQAGDNQVSVTVTDTGIGIDPQDLPKIFDRFYRADRARTAVVSGNGLGLAIAQAIILAHQGSISVQSTLGQGSKFTITLPLPRTGQLKRDR